MNIEDQIILWYLASLLNNVKTHNSVSDLYFYAFNCRIKLTHARKHIIDVYI